jgi:hypothetical protein
MQEIEAGEPAELEIEAPPGLLPDLSAWGILEVERGVCEDTFENRKAIRANKGKANTVFDTNGLPTGYLQVVTAEMYATAQGLSKSDLLTDPDDYNSDYLNGVKLLLAQNAEHLAPTWVLNTTKTFIRQQDRIKELGADGELYAQQTRLVSIPARCKTTKADGTRCWGWADGSSDLNGMCRVHARRANRSPSHGMSTRQIMRNRMDSAVPGLWEKLETLTDSEDERIALTAIRDMMDRAGYKAVDYTETKVEVTVSDASDVVKDRLAKLKKGQEEKANLLKQMRASAEASTEDVVDAEVIEDE